MNIPNGWKLVPIEPTEEMAWVAARHYESDEYTGVRSTYKAMVAVAPQPEPVDTDLRRDAELWRAHQKRKQDLIDRGFLKSCLRSEDAAMLSQGEQKCLPKT